MVGPSWTGSTAKSYRGHFVIGSVQLLRSPFCSGTLQIVYNAHMNLQMHVISGAHAI